MVKHIHMLFVALLVISFAGRVLLAQYKPELLSAKWLKIAPHAIAGVLLLTGIVLIIQGDWLANNFAWIVAKIAVLGLFMYLSVLALKLTGNQRWRAFAGALLCLYYIAKVAIAKQVLFFI